MAESFELREEIRRGGEKYFLQTSYLPGDNKVKTSFFKNGKCFDYDTLEFRDDESRERIVDSSKSFHNRNRDKFLLLLDAKEKIAESNKASAHLKLAEALFLRNMYEEAVKEASASISKGEEGSGPFKVIGESYFELGALDKALTAVEQGIKINPDYPDLHNLMGKIFYREKRCRKAVEAFKKAASLNYYYGEPYLNIVKAYVLNSVIKEDYELSRELKDKFDDYLDRAFTLNPFIDAVELENVRDLFAKEDYDGVLAKIGEFEESRERSYIDRVIGELYLMILKSGERLDVDQINNYLERVKRIIDQNPNFADAYNSLGVLYTAKCKITMDKAEMAFKRALEINDKYEKAVKNIRLTENERQGVFILLKALLD